MGSETVNGIKGLCGIENRELRLFPSWDSEQRPVTHTALSITQTPDRVSVHN